MKNHCKVLPGFFRFYHNSGKQNILKLRPSEAKVLFSRAYELDINNIVLERNWENKEFKGDMTFIYTALSIYNKY